MSAIKAFNETLLSTGAIDADVFVSTNARQLRYAMFWALYEGTAYRSILHSWAQGEKSGYSLYEHIRPIYNPTYRLINFWQSHLMGGLLDPAAGGGKTCPARYRLKRITTTYDSRFRLSGGPLIGR